MAFHGGVGGGGEAGGPGRPAALRPSPSVGRQAWGRWVPVCACACGCARHRRAGPGLGAVWASTWDVGVGGVGPACRGGS